VREGVLSLLLAGELVIRHLGKACGQPRYYRCRMPLMDPWKRYRLLACIAVMVGILGAGVWGRLNAPQPTRVIVDGVVYDVEIEPPPPTNPLDRIRRECWPHGEHWPPAEREQFRGGVGYDEFPPEP
jgi:hypothetical protein